jgi:hypothetical protein
VYVQVLHLAGNGLSGTLALGDYISSQLTDVSLSHNRLSGTIAASLQTHSFSEFDLSFNRFRGNIHELIGDSYFPSTTASTILRSASINTSVREKIVDLVVNRLSGTISSSVITSRYVNVLDGTPLHTYQPH